MVAASCLVWDSARSRKHWPTPSEDCRGGYRHGGQWRRLCPPLRHRMTFYLGAVCVGLMAVVVVGCGGSGGETPSSTVRATSPPTPVDPVAVLLADPGVLPLPTGPPGGVHGSDESRPFRGRGIHSEA